MKLSDRVYQADIRMLTTIKLGHVIPGTEHVFIVFNVCRYEINDEQTFCSDRHKNKTKI